MSTSDTGQALIPVCSLKATREALCLAQGALHEWARMGRDVGMVPYRVARIGALITEIDRHRPLGPDGKHGDHHTATCGCEDTGQAREPGYERIAQAIADVCDAAEMDIDAYRNSVGIEKPYLALARALDNAGLIDWGAFDEPSGDTVEVSGLPRIAEAPEALRGIAADIEATKPLSASILRLIAEDVTALLDFDITPGGTT